LPCGKRSEMCGDHRRIDLIEARRTPYRGVVLVDDGGADALVEIVAGEHSVENAELHAHALVDLERRASFDLVESHTEAGRRFDLQRSKRFGCKRVARGIRLQARDHGVERAEREML